jgi:peroxiredoxin
MLKAQSKLDFDILFDEGNKVAERFGIAMRLPDELIEAYRKIKVDLETYNGDTLWTLPAPARIVADRNGIVRAIDSDPDYTRRPEPSDTVEALRKLT